MGVVYYFISGNPETVGEDEFVAFVQERFEDIDFMQRASESLRQFDEESCGTLTRDTMKVILTQRGQSPDNVFNPFKRRLLRGSREFCQRGRGGLGSNSDYVFPPFFLFMFYVIFKQVIIGTPANAILASH